MGTDIHFVVERRKKEAPGTRWIGTLLSDECPGRLRPVIARRNYSFFAEVAGVRGRTATTAYERNIPEDVSELAWQQYMHAPTDHHTASHMPVHEFVAAYRRASPLEDESRAMFDAYDLLGIEDYDDRYEHRVVFWFDN